MDFEVVLTMKRLFIEGFGSRIISPRVVVRLKDIKRVY